MPLIASRQGLRYTAAGSFIEALPWPASPRPPRSPRPSPCTSNRACSRSGSPTAQTFRIPFELMRVYSPSAEVQGHGPGQEVLQTGKREVELTELEPVGNYAVQPTFSDGHDSRHLLLGLPVPPRLAAGASCGRSTSSGCARPASSATRRWPQAGGGAAAATTTERGRHEPDPFRLPDRRRERRRRSACAACSIRSRRSTT